ncbi:unnamed protein product, partial [Prorocentrum cordatum]
QEVVVAAWGRESVARASEENLTQVPYRVCGSLKFGCSGAPGTLPGLLCRTVETQETPQDEKTGSESLGPRFLQDTFLQASQIAPEQIAGPRRFADASAMRLDLEPVLLHPAVADASSMHRRCGAILRPHLLRPHSGSQKVTISGRPCMRFWGARRYRIKRRRTCRRGLPGGGEPSEPTIGIVEPIVSQLPKPEKETLMQILRLLSAPVYSSWLPILIGGSVFAGIRARGLRQAAKGSQALLEYLCTRTVLLKSADAVASIGRAMGERGVLQSGIQRGQGTQNRPRERGFSRVGQGSRPRGQSLTQPRSPPPILLPPPSPPPPPPPLPSSPSLARGVAAGGPERGQQGAPERGGPEPAARPARPRSLTVARRAASWRPFGDPRSRVAGRRSPRARGRGERRGGRGGKGGARGRGPGH